MLIYASKLSARLRYIVDFVTTELFDHPATITNDQDAYKTFNGPRINYSQQAIAGCGFWICNVDLLYQQGISGQPINCFTCNGNSAFFQTSSGDHPFDIFAAAFYLISRYEEYLPHVKDKYGRYAHENSLAFKESFLHLPLVNIWLKDFKTAIAQVYPDLVFRDKTFTFQPTYDIDIAWSYRNKGWWRTVAGTLKSALTLDWYGIKLRLAVLLNKSPDPFDSYQWLHAIHRKAPFKPIYFFLVALKQKGYDKNINPSNNELQQLIREHHALYRTGIHPSWQSGDDEQILVQEIQCLQLLVSDKVSTSRQHYLRFVLPTTYQRLIKEGITNDHSMGYGAVNGFRASVASSYIWYDLQHEKATQLVIHPFCFMDATAFYELKLSPAQALEQLLSLYNIIHHVGGSMVTLWHNNFLGTDRQFTGWRKVYEDFFTNMIGP